MTITEQIYRDLFKKTVELGDVKQGRFGMREDFCLPYAGAVIFAAAACGNAYFALTRHSTFSVAGCIGSIAATLAFANMGYSEHPARLENYELMRKERINKLESEIEYIRKSADFDEQVYLALTSAKA